MSTNKPDPVAHMSDLQDLEQRFDLKLEKLKNEILRWMLAQTLTLIGAMAAFKLFG
ncbi:hypothetical protein [Duganella sp. Root1480D1]|uniref:hypothetical protein n=1 Tax=Duganella sp. Root1480D1 TaxID=1736471 RepID=UPI000AD919BC|nr:hypothetical protein [Duganella sp. Root1480D1]